MKIKKYLIYYLLAIFLLLNIVAATLATMIYAKYISSTEKNSEIEVQNFEVNGVLSGGQSLVQLTDGTWQVDAADYPDLNLSLVYQGDGRTYSRVMITETWVNVKEVNGAQVETVLLTGHSTYSLESKIYAGNDDYLYVTEALSGDQTIPVLSGATRDSGQDVSGLEPTYVKIMVKVDTVQYNRYQTVWGISNLPWEGATP